MFEKHHEEQSFSCRQSMKNTKQSWQKDKICAKKLFETISSHNYRTNKHNLGTTDKIRTG